MSRARADGDPIRLVWTLFYVAICQAALRIEDEGVAPAEEAVQIADATANPTARSMARYALGLVLKKSQPDRALTLFDEAAGLAEAVQNFWWHGIALMEAASTRAVHGDPAIAARELIVVIDHWDRVGDWSQQWLNLRYVTRFLIRVGANDDALELHRALLGAGRQSPLSAAQLAALGDGYGRTVERCRRRRPGAYRSGSVQLRIRTPLGRASSARFAAAPKHTAVASQPAEAGNSRQQNRSDQGISRMSKSCRNRGAHR